MGTERNRRRQLVGRVVSNKMDKTAVIVVTRRFMHPVYKKYITRSKKYYAHDEGNVCQIGDDVIIEASRPISRLKRWRVREITKSPGTVEAI